MNKRKPLYDSNTLKSHEVAAILGVTGRTLRNWLQAKKIPEPRRDPKSGFRLWSQQDVETIRRIMGVKR
jgi:DNA-binding transcriptional MerR regulator